MYFAYITLGFMLYVVLVFIILNKKLTMNNIYFPPYIQDWQITKIDNYISIHYEVFKKEYLSKTFYNYVKHIKIKMSTT